MFSPMTTEISCCEEREREVAPSFSPMFTTYFRPDNLEVYEFPKLITIISLTNV